MSQGRRPEAVVHSGTSNLSVADRLEFGRAEHRLRPLTAGSADTTPSVARRTAS